MDISGNSVQLAAELIEKAVDQASQSAAHKAMRGQGEEVDAILGVWQAGPELRSAGLLHRFVCEEAISTEEVAQHCGSRVAFLTNAYHCLVRGENNRPHAEGNPNRRRGKELVLERIKAYCAAYRDPELAFLHAAVLWSRFEEVRSAAPEQRRTYAEEGRLLLAPFLEMLGMRQLQAEVIAWLVLPNDASFRKLEHNSHRIFVALAETLTPHLPAAQFTHRIHTQFHISTLSGPPKTINPGDDPLNIDLLVDDEESCYGALYWIHTLYQPIEGGLADYIADSRVNGCRYLQTTVMADVDAPAAEQGGQKEGAEEVKDAARRVRVNFRISTGAMNEINCWGLAAFVLRERLQDDLPTGWWNDIKDGYAQILSAPLGSLPETVYVFSPHGELFHFHRGATVVDYAYQLHSELADRSVRFYVNGEVVEPTTVLHHLDLVELEHDPRAPGPTHLWLSAARTTRARSRIERFLKRQGKGVYEGQRIMDRRLRILEDHFGFNLPEHKVRQAIAKNMRRFRLARSEDLFAEIAAGRLVADRILYPLFAAEITRQIQLPRHLRLRPQQLQLAQCCRPRPGDDIIGRPSQRHGVITKLNIHRKDCSQLAQQETAAATTMINLKWRLQPKLKAIAQFDMTALNEDGLLGDVIGQIYAMLPRVTLHKVEAEARSGVAHIRLNVEAENQEVLAAIAEMLNHLPGHNVDSVRQMDLPLTEQEAIMTLGSTGRHNPYTRLPVQGREMFFGRSQDLARMYEWMQAGTGSIWLRGQKRVGKTSLLLHLKRYYLESQAFVPVYVDFQMLGAMDDDTTLYEIASAIYNDLQTDTERSDIRMGELNAPLRELFEHDPQNQLIAYLRHIQSRMGARRLVLLLDEFSRAMDAYHLGRLDEGFFARWRGLMLATMPGVSYVTVVQQKSYEILAQTDEREEREPIWELLELGEQLQLKPLGNEDVRRLIEWPIRNFLEYGPETVDYVARLTGGSPFLIQAFCFKLVAHMRRLDRRQVTRQDVEAVRQEFMLPGENLFAHITDLIHGIGHHITQQMAQLAQETADGAVSWTQLRRALPNVRPTPLRHTLQGLVERDVLNEADPDSWHFASLLFQQWLALNMAT